MNVLRGWSSIDVQVRGRAFRVINTHLEDRLPPALPDVQLLQAAELLTKPANTTLPVILAGDFNSDANGNYSPGTYSFLTNQGTFTDPGSATRDLTWGHDESLSDPAVPFVYRLDWILFRGSSFRTNKVTVVDPIIGVSLPLWFAITARYSLLWQSIDVRTA